MEQDEASPLLDSTTTTSDHQYLQSQSHSENASLITRSWLELQKIWQLAAPSIFSRVAMFSITQAFAGDLDLAAISIATTVIICITFGILLGMASALETLCGQAYGANQFHMLGIYLQRSWIVLSICSIILLPLFIYATPILKLLGQSTDVAERTGLVALWLIPMHRSFPVQFSLQRFLQSQRKTAVIAWVSGLALGIHVLVTMSINGWEMMIPLAFLAATGVRVANELGAGDGEGAKFATKVAVCQSTIIGLMFCVIVTLLRDKLPLIFSSSSVDDPSHLLKQRTN